MCSKLCFKTKIDIRNESAGLTEPSGLTISRDGMTLWTVSDDTRTVFKLDIDGKLIKGASFPVGHVGFEGISLDVTGNYLYVVQEGGNILAKYSLQTKHLILSVRLSKLKGYEQVERFFSSDDKNKGLEGVTVHTHTGDLFLLKEAHPGLLMEITPDLTKLVAFRKLSKKRGFRDHNLNHRAIDYSGIAYDSTRDAFWIVSDKAQRIYLYSWEENSVLFDQAIKFVKGSGMKLVRKAEGVAYDSVRDRLYIVSDETAHLYVYDIH